MVVRENIALATLSTLRVGGVARFVIECASDADVRDALGFAREQGSSWAVLGQGSNVLAPDAGYDGVVLLMRQEGIEIREDGNTVYVTAAAGVSWDALVTYAAERALWGMENLAGIPGTVGAAPVQNIGAYGMEVKDTIAEVRAYDTESGEVRSFSNEECQFGYRDSRFKRDRSQVILSVTFRLSKVGVPSLGYKDLAAYALDGAPMDTPEAIGNAVRAIRAKKFPDLREYGTAGSFFKNPTISPEAYESLQDKYQDLPGFPNESGVKIPLAFVLDKVLELRGYREGKVWLFDAQPLVLVADSGARASDIDAFANGIARRVHDATGIAIEREVQTFR